MLGDMNVNNISCKILNIIFMKLKCYKCKIFYRLCVCRESSSVQTHKPYNNFHIAPACIIILVHCKNFILNINKRCNDISYLFMAEEI